jgi:hypothetical protein
MTTKATGIAVVDTLLEVRKGTVEFVDVPEFGFAMVDGAGAPEGGGFEDAVQALYTVSYTAHFMVKKATGSAPRVMPLEGLWWVEGAGAQAVMERVAAGQAVMDESNREEWRWQAMIMQLPPIDEGIIEAAVAAARVKKPVASLDRVRYERWEEGPSAQLLHIGPYAAEPVSIVALHDAIAAHGSRPRGRHHEIYLGDPRTSAPEKLRTILRQPIEPA